MVLVLVENFRSTKYTPKDRTVASPVLPAEPSLSASAEIRASAFIAALLFLVYRDDSDAWRKMFSRLMTVVRCDAKGGLRMVAYWIGVRNALGSGGGWPDRPEPTTYMRCSYTSCTSTTRCKDQDLEDRHGDSVVGDAKIVGSTIAKCKGT